ncbi:hypothetical protein VNI00_002406 [Paramarasmius palmivorus]|uniref:Uncharacterized protein n=1 Tax=Paramarasmius palmivorus TaxID=297713 RepID=A0AAW0DZI7_9AGAR
MDRVYQDFLTLFPNSTPYTGMQPAPPIPKHLLDKPCVWGYRLSDDIFHAYEQPNPPSSENKLSVRYNTMFWMCEKLGIRPMLDFVMGATEDQAYVIWSRHLPTANIAAPAIPSAASLQQLRQALKIEVDGQWYLHPRFITMTS